MANQQRSATPQTTAEATQLDTLVLGVAPAVAMASLYQSLANAAALASLNAVQAQQQAFIEHQAATDAAVALLYSMLDDP